MELTQRVTIIEIKTLEWILQQFANAVGSRVP